MKKILIILTVLAAVMLTSSCQKELPDAVKNIDVSQGGQTPNPTQVEKYVRASAESLSFTSPAGSLSFTISSNTSWSIKSDQDWCMVSSSSGSNNATLTVNVSENTSTSSRTAIITISSTDAGSVKVSITQAGANSDLQLNKNNLLFTAAESNDSFTITSNFSWSVTSDQIWCTVSTSSGSNNASVTVNVSENKSTSSRSATITVKAGEQSQTIAVTQAGANPTLQLNMTSMAFDSSGSSESFSITSNTNWTVESNRSWCTLSSSSGLDDGTITVRVSENTSTDSRTATVTVRVGDISQTIAITQEGAKPVYESTRLFMVNGVSFKMIAVEGGTFTMGATSEQGSDAYDSEKPTHSVTLSSYSIGETEVTQALWQAVMGSNPSHYSGSNKPVECVSWDDCQDFIRKLNALTGENFRLPTEAEWEYAARGGNKSRGYKYAGSNTLGNVAWCWDNIPSQSSGSAGYGTQVVATKSPNELGLCDMSGNVCEWCQDWYGDYSSSSQTNPTGPSSGYYRVFRGGDWGNYAGFGRVSRRYYYDPADRGSSLGLRLAL